jgi:hypothetical protein
MSMTGAGARASDVLGLHVGALTRFGCMVIWPSGLTVGN